MLLLSASAQELDKDSLYVALRNVESPAERTKIFLNLSEYFLYKNNDSASFYMLKAKNSLLYQSSDLQYLEVDRLLGLVLREHGRLDSAIAILERSLDYIENKMDQRQISQDIILVKGTALRDLSSLNRLKGSHAPALEYSLSALTIYDSLQKANPKDNLLRKSMGEQSTL
ncbi:MAG: hypothetical protein AAGI25_20490 [Bacteroidota bacterium]